MLCHDHVESREVGPLILCGLLDGMNNAVCVQAAVLHGHSYSWLLLEGIHADHLPGSSCLYGAHYKDNCFLVDDQEGSSCLYSEHHKDNCFLVDDQHEYQEAVVFMVLTTKTTASFLIIYQEAVVFIVSTIKTTASW